jgi:hypothetical protein
LLYPVHELVHIDPRVVIHPAYFANDVRQPNNVMIVLSQIENNFFG